MRLLRVRTKNNQQMYFAVLKCILHDNLFSASVFRHFISYFLDKVLISGLTGLYKAIIALVRQDILFRGPKLGC